MKTINKNIYSVFLVLALLPDIHSQTTDGIDKNDDRNEGSEKTHLFESTAHNIENSLSKIIAQSKLYPKTRMILSNHLVTWWLISNLDNKFENKLITLRGEQIDFLERMKKHSEKLIANQNLIILTL